MAYTCILFVHDLEQPNAHALTARGRKDCNFEYCDILPHQNREEMTPDRGLGRQRERADLSGINFPTHYKPINLRGILIPVLVTIRVLRPHTPLCTPLYEP